MLADYFLERVSNSVVCDPWDAQGAPGPVPPVDGQPQVVTIDDPLSDAAQWEITEVSTARGDLDGAAGKVF